jgi:Right handed beta helix region
MELGGSALLVGVLYGTGSSGVIKDVTTRNQLNSGEGIGIRADNTNSTQELLTIEDSSVHDFDDAGILVEGNFTATVNANHVTASNATNFVDGIFVQSAGSIADNDVTGAGISSGGGIIGDFPDLAISGNTVSNWEFGLADLDGAKYTSNTVGNTATGFVSFADGATVESNTITQAAGAGIEFNCDTGTVKSNTINDAAIGIDNVPSGVISTNTYFNVGAIRNACSSAPIATAIELKEICHGNHIR